MQSMYIIFIVPGVKVILKLSDVFYPGVQPLKRGLWWQGKRWRKRRRWALTGEGTWLLLWHYSENNPWTKKLPWGVRSRPYWVDGPGLSSERCLQWGPRGEGTGAVVVGPLLTDRKEWTALHLCLKAAKKWRKIGVSFIFFEVWMFCWFHLNAAFVFCSHLVYYTTLFCSATSALK